MSAAELNRYACDLEDAVQETTLALQLAAEENLNLRDILTDPVNLSNYAQYMFGPGGVFDVTQEPEYQLFQQYWTAAEQAAAEQAVAEQAAQQQAMSQPQPELENQQVDYSRMDPMQAQAIRQQAMMQQILNQNQQAATPQIPVRAGFPAPPQPGAENPGDISDLKDIFTKIPPEQRYAALQNADRNQMRQLAANMFRF